MIFTAALTSQLFCLPDHQFHCFIVCVGHGGRKAYLLCGLAGAGTNITSNDEIVISSVFG